MSAGTAGDASWSADVAAAMEAVRRSALVPTVLLASDFDGTLAPFVDVPMNARAAPGALAALRAAAALPGVHVALVSGRDLETLRTLTGIGQDEPIGLIGTHGAQVSANLPGAGGGDLDVEQRALLASLDDGLGAVAERHPGAWVERKPSAVALHTRTMDPVLGEAALREAAAVAARFPDAFALAGTCVLEIGVVRADKGSALRAVASALAAEAIIYFGDDRTDEFAFAALTDEDDVSVKVGEGPTGARYRVREVADVVACLQAWVAARAGLTDVP